MRAFLGGGSYNRADPTAAPRGRELVDAREGVLAQLDLRRL
jgi:hypothetical protein